MSQYVASVLSSFWRRATTAESTHSAVLSQAFNHERYRQRVSSIRRQLRYPLRRLNLGQRGNPLDQFARASRSRGVKVVRRKHSGVCRCLSAEDSWRSHQAVRFTTEKTTSDELNQYAKRRNRRLANGGEDAFRACTARRRCEQGRRSCSL